MIHKNPQSPQHECEPSHHGVGFFPWSQCGALGLTKLQTSGFTCCRALGWGVLEKDLSSSRRSTGAGLEAVGTSCTREIHIGYWGKCFPPRVVKV